MSGKSSICQQCGSTEIDVDAGCLDCRARVAEEANRLKYGPRECTNCSPRDTLMAAVVDAARELANQDGFCGEKKRQRLIDDLKAKVNALAALSAHEAGK